MNIPISRLDLLSPFLGKKSLFLHIPKCGGMSIQESFGIRAKLCPSLRWKDASGHLTYSQYKKVFHAHNRDLENFFIFTVVRNPWDWHVSWYNYLKNDINGLHSGMQFESRLLKEISFSEYIEWLDNKAIDENKNQYLTKQISDWLLNDKNEIKADYILHQENLEKELNKMLNSLGSPLMLHLQRINQSRSKSLDYKSYYDSNTMKIIEKRHFQDINLFGYSF